MGAWRRSARGRRRHSSWFCLCFIMCTPLYAMALPACSMLQRRAAIRRNAAHLVMPILTGPSVFCLCCLRPALCCSCNAAVRNAVFMALCAMRAHPIAPAWFDVLPCATEALCALPGCNTHSLVSPGRRAKPRIPYAILQRCPPLCHNAFVFVFSGPPPFTFSTTHIHTAQRLQSPHSRLALRTAANTQGKAGKTQSLLLCCGCGGLADAFVTSCCAGLTLSRPAI